jgi:transcriptional antiterminator NusG
MGTNWYVLKVMPGKERQMSDNFNSLISLGRMKYVSRFICPIEKEFVTLRKKKVLRDRVLYNGYLYFESETKLNDGELREISNYPFVMSLLGNKIPQLLGPTDIRKILKDDTLDEHQTKKIKTFSVGEDVVLTDGPFTSFKGSIFAIKGDKVELHVKVFGRNTPVLIDMEHIQKL